MNPIDSLSLPLSYTAALAIFGLLIALLAYGRRLLSIGGLLFALLMGASLLITAPPEITTLMMIFFVSSSLISKASKHQLRVRGQSEALTKVQEKGTRRDHKQVFANSGATLLCAVLYLSTGAVPFLIGCAAALASATADTWASEIGILSRKAPIYIIKRTPAGRGLSGGVTLLGIAASGAGAALIALSFYLLFASGNSKALLGSYDLETASLIVGVFGFLGALIDSFLGEICQAKYSLPHPLQVYDQHLMTEQRWCGQQENPLISGLWWMDNDRVNLISSVAAALTAALAYALIG